MEHSVAVPGRREEDSAGFPWLRGVERGWDALLWQMGGGGGSAGGCAWVEGAGRRAAGSTRVAVATGQGGRGAAGRWPVGVLSLARSGAVGIAGRVAVEP